MIGSRRINQSSYEVQKQEDLPLIAKWHCLPTLLHYKSEYIKYNHYQYGLWYSHNSQLQPTVPDLVWISISDHPATDVLQSGNSLNLLSCWDNRKRCVFNPSFIWLQTELHTWHCTVMDDMLVKITQVDYLVPHQAEAECENSAALKQDSSQYFCVLCGLFCNLSCY